MRKIFCPFGVSIIAMLSLFFIPHTCAAQSVVGKWQRNLKHAFTIDKATGKQVFVSDEYQKLYDAATAGNKYEEILEMKSDNTFTSTVTAGGKQTIHSGKYSLSGKTLDMNIPLVQGQKTVITVISVTPYTMIWNLVFMNKSNGVQYDRI